MTSQSARSFTVVITRSREGNEELARKLESAGVKHIPIDTISLAPLSDWNEVDDLLSHLTTFDWLVFTSASGAKYFGIRMNALTRRLPWMGKPRVAAVGRQTAEALLGLGVKPDFVPSSYTTRVLAEEFPTHSGTKVLLLRADIAARHLAERLAERGFNVRDAAIYRTLPGGGPIPKTTDADLIAFASPSAVRGLCSLVPEDELRALKRLRAVCIGPATESAAREEGFVNTTVPDTYTLDAVVREVTRLSHLDA